MFVTLDLGVELAIKFIYELICYLLVMKWLDSCRSKKELVLGLFDKYIITY